MQEIVGPDGLLGIMAKDVLPLSNLPSEVSSNNRLPPDVQILALQLMEHVLEAIANNFNAEVAA